MKKTLSVIIPTYNMEKYLNKCLDSLIVAPELMDKLEVLVVNDGSKDRSSEIAHGYADKYPHTFIVIDKENGNYGSCINAALKIATGKYIRVLDADDSYENSNFAGFIDCLDQIDVDLVLTDFIRVDEDDNVTLTRTYKLPAKTKIDFLSVCETEIEVPMQMHSITYRRQILIDLGYKQLEGMSYTDLQWNFEPMINVRDLYYYDKVIYRYLLGREGQTSEEKVFAKNFIQIIKVFRYRLDFYMAHRNNLPKEICGLYTRTLAKTSDLIYQKVLLGRLPFHDELVAFDQALKQCEEVYNHPLLINVKIAEKRYPFTFIDKWRKNNYKTPFILKLVWAIHNTKQKLQRILKKQ